MNSKTINNEKNLNYIILILTVAPILGVIIQAYLSNFLYISFGALWIITIALNVFLAIYDSQFLKKNNKYNPEIGNPMLIPIYIYKRTKILNNNPIMYTFIWCIAVILVSAIPSSSIMDILGLVLIK